MGTNMKLTEREITIMRILWEANEPLLVTEIVQKGGGTVYSVQRIIKNLIAKDMVTVDGFSVTKNIIARKFSAMVSSESIELPEIQELFSKIVSKNIKASTLIASLLFTGNSECTMEELNALQKMITEEKMRLQKLEESTKK